jgi:hypothetical protein
MALPAIGELNWGLPLNAEISADEALIQANAANILQHELNNPPDPHGDRAYTNGLIAAIYAAYNQPNGPALLDSTGHIPVADMPVGYLTNRFDVTQSPYGATGNGFTDDSYAINAALQAANTRGGGEVWLPNGTYACGQTLVIASNTWLHLANGAIIKRIANPAPPNFMLANFNPANANEVPASGNIQVSGGSWDASGFGVDIGHGNYAGGITTPCTPFVFFGASFVTLASITIKNVTSNLTYPFIRLHGCINVSLDNLILLAPPPIYPRNNYTNTHCIDIHRCDNSFQDIANLRSDQYNNNTCSGIESKSCGLTAGYGSDGQGRFCGWSHFIGSSRHAKDYYHTNIHCHHNYATSPPCTAIANAVNWNDVTISMNQMQTVNVYSQSWDPANVLINSGNNTSLFFLATGNAQSDSFCYGGQGLNVVGNPVTVVSPPPIGIIPNCWYNMHDAGYYGGPDWDDLAFDPDFPTQPCVPGRHRLIGSPPNSCELNFNLRRLVAILSDGWYPFFQLPLGFYNQNRCQIICHGMDDAHNPVAIHCDNGGLLRAYMRAGRQHCRAHGHLNFDN